MIITLNGDEGSGKTTIAKKIAEAVGYQRITTGEIFREMSKKRGLSLVEYLKLGETDPTIANSLVQLVSIYLDMKDYIMALYTLLHALKIQQQ